jgi:hypothetical protein
MDRDWSRRLGIPPSPEVSMPKPGVSSVTMPGSVDYFIWRLPLSDKLKVASPAEMDRDWSYPDMLDAHAMLDVFDDAMAREAAEAASAAKGR